MLSKTHLVSTVSVCSLPLLFNNSLVHEINLLYFIGGVSLGSQFPDIDEPKSSIGRYVNRFIPFLPYIIKKIFGHRGITHQFIFFLFPLALIFIFSNKFSEEMLTFLISFMFGILLHQVGDMLSGSKKYKGGIKDYFFPFIINGNFFTPFPYFMRCAIGGFKEYIYLFLFLCLMIYEYKIIIFEFVK